MGPHGPRAFTHDQFTVGWVSDGVFSVLVGIGWGPYLTDIGDLDPRQVTMFLPLDQSANLGTVANRGREWIHPRNKGIPCGHGQLAVGWVSWSQLGGSSGS